MKSAKQLVFFEELGCFHHPNQIYLSVILSQGGTFDDKKIDGTFVRR
jgi:hypothetical protein